MNCLKKHLHCLFIGLCFLDMEQILTVLELFIISPLIVVVLYHVVSIVLSLALS